MKRSLLVLTLLFIGAVLPHAVLAATGDVTAVRIEPNGWIADIDIQGFQKGGTYSFGLGANNVPVSPKLVLNVSSQGYDANGNPTSVSRTVLGTQWVRLPYPANTGNSGPGTVKDESVNNGVLTIKVALSDFVYAGENVTATVSSGLYTDSGTGGSHLANASVAYPISNTVTLPYPKVIGRWAWPGYERVTGDFPVEASIFDRFPMNGMPVAAVIFTATDQHGHSSQVTSTSVTPSVHAGDANLVQTYGATIPVSGLTQGDVVTVNFKAYPWVGDASSVLDSSVGADGVAQPSEALGPLYEVNDAQGTYGIGYALVSPDGATTTAKVYSSEAAAEAAGSATAFTTIGKAAEAIKAFQQATYGRANAGGGVILLAAGTYTFPGYAPADLGTSDTWLIVRPAAGTDRSAAVVYGTGTKILNTDKLKFDGVTLTAGSYLAKGRPTTDVLWLHNDNLNVTTVGPVAYKAIYATQNLVTAFAKNFTTYSTNHGPYALVRGNTSLSHSTIADDYAVLGNKNVTPKFIEAGSGAGSLVSENTIYAFNTVYGLTTVSTDAAVLTPILKGMAVIENVIEKTTPTQPLFQLAADNSYAVANNAILWRNTFAGERENLGYNEFGTVGYDRLNWRDSYNIFQSWNNKDDRFQNGGTSAPNANRVGGWPIGYNVGTVGNIAREQTFPPEFNGLSSKAPANPLYVSDASNSGTALGNGNYQLNSGSPAIDIAGTPGAFDLQLPYDLLGNQVTGNGIDAGAYEYTGISQQQQDTTPPAISNAAPTGQLPAGTTQATLSVSTSESSTCRYSTTSGNAFSAMTPFTNTGALTHTTSLTGLTNGSSYHYYVKCQDAAGNTSGDTAVSFSVANPVQTDTVAPTVSITAPADGASVTGTVSLTASASDNIGVAGVQFSLNGTPVGSAISVPPYTYAWNASAAAPGTYAIAAVARDAAGNTATSSSVTVTVPASQSGADTTSGMLLHLTFDAADTSAAVANDVSGNGHSAALTGSPAPVPGRLGQALSFNGSNFADLGTSAFGLSSAYTMSFWVNQTANGLVSYPTIMARNVYGYPFGYQLYGSGTTNKWRINTRTSGGTVNLVPASTVSKNQWYHVAIVQNGSARSVYVNGTLAASDTLTGTISWPAGSNWIIGKATANTSAADGIVGAIDDVRVYSRALAPADITALSQGL